MRGGNDFVKAIKYIEDNHNNPNRDIKGFIENSIDDINQKLTNLINSRNEIEYKKHIDYIKTNKIYNTIYSLQNDSRIRSKIHELLAKHFGENENNKDKGIPGKDAYEDEDILEEGDTPPVTVFGNIPQTNTGDMNE